MTSAGKLGFDALNSALKAAGEETRLRVLALLAEAELTVSDLTDILRQSQPRLSRHLKLLAEAGLVERFREGTWAFFRLAEHGGGADVALVPRREDNKLVVDVVDRGPGIPADLDAFSTGRLGLQIVRTLITEELGGELDLGPASDGVGTRARISVPLPG